LQLRCSIGFTSRWGSACIPRVFTPVETGPHFAVAPVVDYSTLDTWHSLLRTDCSALHIVCPELVTDLTRCPTLGALRRLRIAPLSMPCARADHGSLRATDCSVVQHLELRPAHGLLRTRHLVLLAPRGLLRSWRLAPYAACRLLCTRYLAFPCRSTDRSVR